MRKIILSYVLLIMLSFLVSLSAQHDNILDLEGFDKVHIQKERKRLCAGLDLRTSFILQEAFNVIDSFASENDPTQIWQMLNQKSTEEIIQHATVLKNRDLAQVIEWKEISLWDTRDFIESMVAEMSDEEKASSSRFLKNAERELEELKTLGMPLIDEETLQSRIGMHERRLQTEAIRGKWKELLADALSECTSMEIISTQYNSANPGQHLHTINGKQNIQDFLDLIQIEESDLHHYCYCHGDAELSFLNDNGEEVARLSFHHGVSLRWRNGPWTSDAILAPSGRIPLLKWFSSQGFSDFETMNLSDIEP